MNSENKGRVFVVQKTMRFDHKMGELVPKFDVGPAMEYGHLEYLLSPTASPFRPQTILGELHSKLRDFNSDDHLLLIGNPVIIGMSVAIAAEYNDGDVNVLQWNGREGKYLTIRLRGLFSDCWTA